jgi:hypothetical protein
MFANYTVPAEVSASYADSWEKSLMPPKGWRKSEEKVVVPTPGIRRCPGGHPVDHPQAVRCPHCNAVVT